MFLRITWRPREIFIGSTSFLNKTCRQTQNEYVMPGTVFRLALRLHRFSSNLKCPFRLSGRCLPILHNPELFVHSPEREATNTNCEDPRYRSPFRFTSSEHSSLEHIHLQFIHASIHFTRSTLHLYVIL